MGVFIAIAIPQNAFRASKARVNWWRRCSRC